MYCLNWDVIDRIEQLDHVSTFGYDTIQTAAIKAFALFRMMSSETTIM